jgi:Bifunctional DNA primase/polymerase, N-terminal/Primase C terminal 1 (PriCT-1)
MTELLEAALRYAQRGWPVFPCKDKRPLLTHGLLDATTDRATVERWWTRVWPAGQIAVRTGRESGLFVLDADPRHGGDDSLHELEREHGALPATATVKTPGGGPHYYFRHPGCEVRNSESKVAPGIDIRCDGGYVLAPPSMGQDDRRYEPDERAPLAAVPQWLLALIAESTSNREPAPASDWITIVRDGVGEGQRNAQLARVAGHLLARDVDARLVREITLLVARHRCRPPLEDSEADRIVESIAQRELAKRGRA